MHKTIQRIVEVDLNEVRSPKYDENVDLRGGEHSDTCFICGKRVKDITKSKSVQYLTNGNIVSTDQEMDNSQGFFPVGNDCARKLVIKFAL